MAITPGIYKHLTPVEWTHTTSAINWNLGDLHWIARWLDSNNIDCGVIMSDFTYLDCRITGVVSIRGGGHGLVIDHHDYPESRPIAYHTFKVKALLIPSEAYFKLLAEWRRVRMDTLFKVRDYVENTLNENWYGKWDFYGSLNNGIVAKFTAANNPPAGFEEQPKVFMVDIWEDGRFMNPQRYTPQSSNPDGQDHR